MLRTLRNQNQREDEGFTLIELLVVVIIIGILAAIAIPVFLNQREKARNAAANSDLRNLLTAQEGFYTENDNYTVVSGATDGEAVLGNDGFTSSSGVLICADVDDSGDTFYAESYHEGGTLYYYYQSNVGTIEKVGDHATAGITGTVAGLTQCVPAE